MIASVTFLVLFGLMYILVQSEITNLNVRRMDKSLIAKKRQDTLEMCRIFNRENSKILHSKPKIIQSYNQVGKSHNRRHKREAEMRYAVNPALNAEDARRVESIVEKLYDDLEEKGHKITYRTYSIPTTTKVPKKMLNFTSNKVPKRRFYFAPKKIFGPTTSHKPMTLQKKPNAIYEKARWKHGIIPYFIDSKTYDAQLQDGIIAAFDYIEKATCIRLQKLRERPTDKRSLQDVDWVYITNPSGVKQCVHSNEKHKFNGVQMSVLGYDCMSIGDIVHEVMHILGFSHEHTRPDRDQHISIIWDNIKPGYKKYFEIAKPGDQYTLEHLPYDYASVLHYPSRAFSRNGQHTILTDDGIKIGQREGLSEIDLEKIGSIYSSECVDRNREYLVKTCPSVVKSEENSANVTQQEIEDYFKNRLWPFGLVHYKLRDQMEFSTEEKENIKAVIWHIEKETCIQFKDVTEMENNEVDSVEDAYALQRLTDEAAYTATPEPVDQHKELANVVLMDPTLHQDQGNLSDKDVMKNVSENEINNEDDQKEYSRLPDNIRRNVVSKTNESQVKPKSESRHIKKQTKPKRKNARRHANNVIVLARSALPGCKCPKPGKPNGNTVLEINAECFNTVNDLLHLFVHVLGLDHQHNMFDRDSYLHIVWKNLTPDIKKELQEKLPQAASVGFPYDYQSVMHYPWLQIKNGVTNMMYPIWNDGWIMGHWQGLSSFDVQKLNLLYFSQCSERHKQSQTF